MVERPEKPQKPYPEFPLYPHPSGKWAKKIRGKIQYFGRWDDSETALEEYQESIRVVVSATAGFSVKLACNTYLTARKKNVVEKTLAARSYTDLRRTSQRFSDFIGGDRLIESLSPADFLRYKSEFAKTNNPVSVGNEITRVKTMLKWLVTNKHIKEIDVGPDFRKPPAKVARKHKREMGLKLFTADQIHAILDESGVRMHAMILLGINCGFQNDDCETLSLTTVTKAMKKGIVEHVRAKTEVERACPLWPETLQSLQAWLERRPKSNSPFAFILHDGEPLSSVNADVGKRFRSVRDAAGVRDGGFSWLRKTFATYASECADQVAVNFIMGHVDGTIPGLYRQLVRSKRLQIATETVRKWLY